MTTTGPDQRTDISAIRLLAALAAVGVCAAAQWYIRQRLHWTDASLALVGGAVAAAWLLGRPAEQLAVTAPARRGNPWIGSLLTLGGLGLYAFGVHELTTAWHASFDSAAPLTVLGVVLWSAGLALCFPAARGRPWVRWETIVFTAVLAVGLFARFYRYDYYPPDGVCAVEEPQSGQWTYLIMKGARPWEFLGDRWLAVPFFKALGTNLTALRIPYTIVSWLTLIPFYLMMRALVSRQAGLFATALFAMSSWHLMYARLGHAIFPTTLIVMIVMYLCVRAHQRGGLGTYVWIGFLCGYTLYTYAGYRGTPAFAAMFLGISFLLNLRSWLRAAGAQKVAARRRVIWQVIGLVLAVAAFAGPLKILRPRLAGENSGHFFEAAQRSVVETAYYSSDLQASLPRLWERTLMTARLFNHLGDGSETFNLPAEPHLDPITGVLMAVALAYCLIWGLRRWQGYFAFVFLTLLIVGSILVGNFDPRRLQGVIPPIYIMIAFLADRFEHVGRNLLGAAARTILPLVCGIVVGAIFFLNWDLFFGRMISDPRVRAAFQNRYTAAARYLKTLPDDAYVLFVSDIHWFFRSSDLEWMRDKRIPGQVTRDLLPVFLGNSGPWEGRDLRVIVQDPLEADAVVDLLRRRFPTLECEDATHPDRPVDPMRACDMPEEGGRPFSGGAQARYFRGASQVPFLERTEPVISYTFVPAECRFPLAMSRQSCRAEWEGTFEVERAGAYDFRAETRHGHIVVHIDDEPLKSRMELSAGTHRLRAEADMGTVVDEGNESGARLLWKSDSTTDWQLVPFVRFD